MQKREYYKNGYGVSVIDNEYSYGLELAVISWSGEWDEEIDRPKKIDHWELCYDSPITDDVCGYLDFETLNILIEKVKNLKGD